MDTKLPTHWETYEPILKVLSDGQSIHRRKLTHRVRDEHYGDLPDEMKGEETSRGVNKLLNRIDWGISYLKLAKLVEQPQRGFVKITDKGDKLLKRGNITAGDVNKDNDFLAHSEAVNVAKEATKITDVASSPEVESGENPLELIDQGLQEIKDKTKVDLLDKLKKMNPDEFEKVVLALLEKMGYGDSKGTPKSHDGGIDGIINEDPLGLDKIYMQAKRYSDSKVNELEICNFIGAMPGAITKGIFVTTSRFDDKAVRRAEGSGKQIILVDGAKLVDLMYEYGVGVQVQESYDIKEVDEDFFEPIS